VYRGTERRSLLPRRRESAGGLFHLVEHWSKPFGKCCCLGHGVMSREAGRIVRPQRESAQRRAGNWWARGFGPALISTLAVVGVPHLCGMAAPNAIQRCRESPDRIHRRA
jgi:hypothetical protein